VTVITPVVTVLCPISEIAYTISVNMRACRFICAVCCYVAKGKMMVILIHVKHQYLLSITVNSEVFVFHAKLRLLSFRFYFDFSPTYVGVGMICPSIVNVSVLLGGILSWGVMWPLIAKKKGSWYPADAGDSSLHGLQAYRVNIHSAYGWSSYAKLHNSVSP
jgi:uncharacterized oligopeptide transporter (OPT) family protein